MCIAAIVQEGKLLSEGVFLKCAAGHRHGMGFAYVDADGKVAVEKRENSGHLKAAKDFYQVYADAFRKVGNKHKMILHFRTSTGGSVARDNAHPFMLKSGGALVHNGFLFSTPNNGAGKSDTSLFVDKYGESLTKEFVDANIDKIGKAMGSWNKVAILWPSGEVSVLNKDGWNAAECGTLFSNTTWK